MADEKQTEVQIWLRKADNDFRGAEIDLDADPPLVEDALFHCQQATEKAMKAFLTANDTIFRKTHDLDELASSCEKLNSSLKVTLDPARELTVFAWEFRYPGSDEAPPKDEAVDSLSIARKVVEAIRRLL